MQGPTQNIAAGTTKPHPQSSCWYNEATQKVTFRAKRPCQKVSVDTRPHPNRAAGATQPHSKIIVGTMRPHPESGVWYNEAMTKK